MSLLNWLYSLKSVRQIVEDVYCSCTNIFVNRVLKEDFFLKHVHNDANIELK